jgi:hypothetical protein
VELKRLSKEMLAATKTAQETFLGSVLRNESNSWSEFCKYVKRREGNKEIIPGIKDHNGMIVMVTTEKANILNSYYAYVFCSDRYVSEKKITNSVELKF